MIMFATSNLRYWLVADVYGRVRRGDAGYSNSDIATLAAYHVEEVPTYLFPTSIQLVVVHVSPPAIVDSAPLVTYAVPYGIYKANGAGPDQRGDLTLGPAPWNFTVGRV
jgi:hypothetical protein